MHQIMIPLLVFVMVVTLGTALIIGLAGRRAPLRQRLDRMAGDGEGGAQERMGTRVIGALGSLGARAGAGSASRPLQQRLAQAGLRSAGAARVYLGIKVSLLLTGLMAALVMDMLFDMTDRVRLTSYLCCLGVAFFLPNVGLGLLRARRMTEIRQHLPDAVDLLEICVSAGMGLDAAWNSVTDQIRNVSAIMADEMTLTSLEMNLAVPRAEAMRHMAQRTGADELASLVAVLIQSERFGTPIGVALRTFAGSMRELRSQRAEEAAEKMAVNLLVPMVLFVFPAIFVVAVGPAIITLIQILGN